MKKIFWSVLLTAAMLSAAVLSVSATENVTVQAGEKVQALAEAMVFPTDGSQCTAVCPVCGTNVTWTAVTAADFTGESLSLAKGGHYYVAEDISKEAVNITVKASLSHISCLHLNGKKLTNTSGVVFTGTAGNLNVMGKGEVTGNGNKGADRGATIEISAGGTKGNISLYGGTYQKMVSDDTENVISIRGNGGIINMYAGATLYTGTKGSAVYIQSDMLYANATFNMYGGTIHAENSTERTIDTEAVADNRTSILSVNIYDGEIIGSANAGNAIIRKNVVLNMYGGTIKDGCTSTGGNIYISSGGTMNMYGGTVCGGKAENGGNIYLYHTASLNMYGGTVCDGTATAEGGNIYATGNAETGFANILLQDATVSGGKATTNGGNISALRGNITIDGDTQILNGIADGRGGNLRLYQGKLIMKDGLLTGGTSNYKNPYHEIWLAGSSALPGSMYMLGGVVDSKDNALSAAISVGTSCSLYLAGDATVVDHNAATDSVYTESGVIYICDGWSGTMDARIGNYREAGGTVPAANGKIVTLAEDLTFTQGGSYTGDLTHHGLKVCQSGSSLVVAAAAAVDAQGKGTATAEPLEAWQTGAYTHIKLYGITQIADLGGGELWVDLNGHALTVGGSGTVHAFDSANDAYDAAACGSVTVTGDAVVTRDVQAPNGNRYVAVTEEGKTTMHRLDIRLTAVTLRSEAAGVYYKAQYDCDETLTALVKHYGVAVSLANMPGADFRTEQSETRYTVSNEPFQSGAVATSGSVFGIMKDTNSLDTNVTNSNIHIYANPYICFAMDTDVCLMGDTQNPGKTVDTADFDGIAFSLRDAMNRIDDIYYLYNDQNRANIDAFADRWQEKGMDWDFANIGNIRDVDNSDLQFVEGTTKAVCPVCQTQVTWQAVTQATHGTTAIGAAANGAHYYLKEDIVYTGDADQFIRAPGIGAPACLHLNGHDLTAANVRAIQGYGGTLNVMGNGVVSGNNADENRGATVQINTSDSRGVVNLYGGTYTKPAGNKTASIIAVWNNGGRINLYEDATVISNDINYAVYSGKASLTNATLGIYGAKVVGGSVWVVAPDTEAGNTSILEIGGDAYLEDVVIKSMYVKVKLSGAPVIERLAAVVDQHMNLNAVSEGADIRVSTRGVFTAVTENAADYASYFHPWVSTDKIVVTEDGALRYDINYELYMTPYKRDVSAEAIADGKIHYYFMAGEGMIMSPTTTGELDKWGDSCLIVFPNGETMLVDTGYAVQQPVIIGNLKRMGVTELDYLLITHPHSDHIGAFASTSTFLDEIKVKQVYHDRILATGDVETYWIEDACTARNIPLLNLEQGMELDFGDVHMQVLWPEAGTSEKWVSTGKINDLSMVFRLDYGEHSSLFTADLYEAGETNLINSVGTEILDTDFMKVPHHGWNTSSSEAFVNAVSPELAVATGRVDMPDKYRNRYTAVGATMLFDMYDGYIHVEAAEDGTMTYETSR